MRGPPGPLPDVPPGAGTSRSRRAVHASWLKWRNGSLFERNGIKLASSLCEAPSKGLHAKSDVQSKGAVLPARLNTCLEGAERRVDDVYSPVNKISKKATLYAEPIIL